MRRRLASAALVALAMTGGGTAHAEEFAVYLDTGAVFPTAPPEFSDFWKTGVSVGGGVGVRLTPFWEFATTAHYQRLPADEQGVIGGLLLSGPGGTVEIASIDGRDANAITLVSEVRVHVGRAGSSWDPFLAFGAGFFRVSTTDATVTSTDPRVGAVTVLGDTDSALGATVGGGWQYRVAPGCRLVLDAIYTIGFTEQSSTEYLPIRLGVAIAR